MTGLQEGASCFHRTKHYCPATPSDSSHLLKDDFIQTNEVSYQTRGLNADGQAREFFSFHKLTSIAVPVPT